MLRLGCRRAARDRSRRRSCYSWVGGHCPRPPLFVGAQPISAGLACFRRQTLHPTQVLTKIADRLPSAFERWVSRASADMEPRDAKLVVEVAPASAAVWFLVTAVLVSRATSSNACLDETGPLPGLGAPAGGDRGRAARLLCLPPVASPQTRSSSAFPGRYPVEVRSRATAPLRWSSKVRRPRGTTS